MQTLPVTNQPGKRKERTLRRSRTVASCGGFSPAGRGQSAFVRAGHGSMFPALQVISTVLIALATATAVAHARKLPGKMRLAGDNYLAVQTIYYPGFAISGGIGEAGGLVS